LGPRGLFLVPILLAAALRFPHLASRPMHADEAIHADKFGTLLEGRGYAYDPSEYHGPTLYYLTCPRAAAAVSKLEASGLMREMTERLADDGVRRRYEAAHRDYLARRETVAHAACVDPLPPGTQSAGGMPERVKCLHALVAHELVAGVNPFGAEALDAVGAWWRPGPCIQADTP
jgi:hypothetical protein